VNSESGISSWEDPRVEAQYLFELQCGLLAKVQQADSDADTPVFGEEGQQVFPTARRGSFHIPSLDSTTPVNRLPNSVGTFQKQDGGKSLTELRKKLTEKLALVDPEQANREHQRVATSMRNRLRHLYDFLQNERDSYDIQLARKRKERQRRIQQSHHQRNENTEGRKFKGLSIETQAPKRKFKQETFSAMTLDKKENTPGSPSSPKLSAVKLKEKPSLFKL